TGGMSKAKLDRYRQDMIGLFGSGGSMDRRLQEAYRRFRNFLHRTKKYTSIDGYCTLASLSAKMGLMLFQVRPKLHMLCHLVLHLEHQLER
ncbi:unnamed protein product, partial [Symbiodinium pilosum]